MLINGVVHVHTSYSRDGKLSLHELKEKCRNEGIKFVFISDHAEDLDPFQYDILKQECEELSSELLCFVPGLEFDCLDGLHILGFNLSILSKDLQMSSDGRLYLPSFLKAIFFSKSSLAILSDVIPQIATQE